MSEETFGGWAIVELFGHNMIAGLLSEQSIGGASFVRVDVPGVDGAEGFTKFYGGAAVYAITPTTEEMARVAAGKLAVRPVTVDGGRVAWAGGEDDRMLKLTDRYAWELAEALDRED